MGPGRRFSILPCRCLESRLEGVAQAPRSAGGLPGEVASCLRRGEEIWPRFARFPCLRDPLQQIVKLGRFCRRRRSSRPRPDALPPGPLGSRACAERSNDSEIPVRAHPFSSDECAIYWNYGSAEWRSESDGPRRFAQVRGALGREGPPGRLSCPARGPRRCGSRPSWRCEVYPWERIGSR